MTRKHALRFCAVCVLALAVQLVLTRRQRVGVSIAEHYGRSLRSVFALELALTAEVMREQAGLVGSYDGLVAIEQRLRRELAELRDVPEFLPQASRSELEGIISLLDRDRQSTEEDLEEWKSEHAVLRNSLRFLPVASRALDGFVPATSDERRFKEAASALVRDVLLLHAVSDAAQLERVRARLAALPPRVDQAPSWPSAELALIVLHARIVEARAPHIAKLLQRVTVRPELERAERSSVVYESALARARERAGRNANESFGLSLLAVLSAALAIIVHLRQTAAALRQTTEELGAAVASLELEKEKQRELAQLKSRFISMTSHEFRTPLSAIMSSSELLEAYAERWPRDKKQEHFRRINDAVRGMIGLLDGVLMVGRSDAGKLEFKPEPLDLRRFCEEAVRTAAQTCRGDHEVVLQYDELDAAITADERLLRHAVDNLLSNAIKYSPRGSLVRLRVERRGEDVLLEVSDQGIGIPAADQRRLFETFERGSNVGAIPGSGLGLAIAKRAIDLHGGSLDVVSAVGAGTRSTLRLPRARCAA